MKNQFYSHTAIDSSSWKIKNECKAGATKAQFLDYWQLTSKSTSARKVWAQVFLLPSLLCFFHHHVGMARSSTVLLFQLLSYSTDATKLKRKLHGIIVLLSLYLGLESGNYPKKSFPVCSQNFFSISREFSLLVGKKLRVVSLIEWGNHSDLTLDLYTYVSNQCTFKSSVFIKCLHMYKTRLP